MLYVINFKMNGNWFALFVTKAVVATVQGKANVAHLKLGPRGSFWSSPVSNKLQTEYILVETQALLEVVDEEDDGIQFHQRINSRVGLGILSLASC